MSSVLSANRDDVRYAYRLLLGREPDADGFRHHCEMVRSGSLSALDVARAIMMSDEYSSRQASGGGGLREVSINGVKLFPWQGDVLIGDSVSDESDYEPNVLPLFLHSVLPDHHVLDIGANIGLYSLQAAKRVGAQGKVYAIEPVPRNVRSLCVGIHANGFANVSLFPLAASDRASVVAVFRHDNSSNGIVDYSFHMSESMDFVPTQRLDFLLGGVPRLDVIKIDIEGHEPLAWQGMKALVYRHRPLIFSEFSPVAIRNHSRVDPRDYVVDLFEFCTRGIEVLARDGRRIRCGDPDAVLAEWQAANRAAGMNGELHLDLLVDTRN